jgi:integrating conjugative element protein (TIGR03761 family)
MSVTEKPEGSELKNHKSAARRQPDRRSGARVQPGDLQGTATLVIQTRQAQRLLRGRPGRRRQAGIPGLYPFSARMRTIWMAARQNDPDANGYLVQISKRIEETRLELGHLRQPLEERLHNVTGIEVEIARSTSPVHVPLHFATPYGYMGAYVISDFDQLVCAILTVRHVGLLVPDTGDQQIQRGAKLIRRVLTIPFGWRSLAVTRDDVRRNRQRAREAGEKMGDLPEDILAGTRRAPLAPVIDRRHQAE